MTWVLDLVLSAVTIVLAVYCWQAFGWWRKP